MGQDWTFTEYYYDDMSHPENARLRTFSEIIAKIVTFLKPFQCLFALIGLIMNMFHLAIITRKSMRTNSVYVLMIGITISDMFTMFMVVYNNFNDFFKFVFCSFPDPYWKVLLELILAAIQEIVRRVSTWLAFFMALFRWLIIKNTMSGSLGFLSKSSFALKTNIGVLILSTIITSLTYSQKEVKDVGFEVISTCWFLEKNYKIAHTYSVGRSEFMDKNLNFVEEYAFMSDGIPKMIAAFFLPILAIALVRRLRQAAESRKHLSNSKPLQTDKSIRMVTFMTLFSVFAEGPMGIFSFIRSFYLRFSSIEASVESLDKMLINLVIVNVIAHCFISMQMSSQYRDIATQLFLRKVIRRWKKDRVSVVPQAEMSLTHGPTNVHVLS